MAERRGGAAKVADVPAVAGGKDGDSHSGRAVRGDV
jgi:hypothetical protein